ncbi:hypothetical protein BHM03_00025997 [Ensete ventricosum]|nr:hypothetical protein BHM03_00025997 [Ensete ventricosum]
MVWYPVPSGDKALHRSPFSPREETRRHCSLLLVHFSFLPSSPHAGRRKPTDEESPAGDGSRGEPRKIKYLPFLLLPLLLSPSINHRRLKSTADGRFRRYHPVASGPRTSILSDRYIPPIPSGTE